MVSELILFNGFTVECYLTLHFGFAKVVKGVLFF